MKFENLARLALFASSENGMGELYRQTERTKTEDEAVSDAYMILRDKVKGYKDEMDNLDCAIGSQCWAHEEQGFINGFRFGIRIMVEALKDGEN